MSKAFLSLSKYILLGAPEADEVLRLMNPWMSPGCPRGVDVPLGD